MNKTVLNSLMQVILWAYVFISLGMELLGHCVDVSLTLSNSSPK